MPTEAEFDTIESLHRARMLVVKLENENQELRGRLFRARQAVNDAQTVLHAAMRNLHRPE